jgi:hypothetical protein
MAEKDIISFKKKEIRFLCGKNLAFAPLQEHIRHSEDPEVTMIWVSLVLKEEKTLKVAVWARLSEQFLKHYGNAIRSFYETSDAPPGKVIRPQAIVESMTGHWKKGDLTVASPSALAAGLCKAFTFDIELRTLIEQIEDFRR